MIRQSFSSVLLFLSLVMCPLGVRAATVTVDIEARIDGRDQLIFQDGTLQWEHFEFGAVGRFDAQAWPTIISTSVDGVPALERFEWFPEWSAPAPTAIRQPELSSIFTGLQPSLAGFDYVRVEPVQARAAINLIQRPASDNMHATIVEFDDNVPGGAEWYKARLTFGTEPLVQPQIRQWDVEATVVELNDSQKIFPDLRLGDPVRGVLSIDLTTPPHSTDQHFRLYRHEPGFDVFRMTVENPRDGRQFMLELDPSLPVEVAVNNDEGDPTEGLSDSLSLSHPVVFPGSVPGAIPPSMLMVLEGPADAIADASLPESLQLDDWPFARLEFINDFSKYFLATFTGGDPGSYFFAEIHALRPRAVPEPGAAVLMAIGLTPLVRRRARIKR